MIKAADQKAKILYVDDTEANLLLFEASFEKDYTIFLASSGDKGLEILRSNDISVLISDQRMPGMSGTELLEIAAEEFPHVMRFMLTAYTDYDTVVESINKGQIYGFFNKPFKAREVKMAINKAIEVYTLRQKNQQMLTQLENANRDLLEMEHSRNLFLSSITEEIRMPISKIMTAVHMLKDKVDASGLGELLGFLDSSVSRLESFSFATRQLARLKSPQFELKNSRVSLKELLEIATIEKKTLLNESFVELRFEELSNGVAVEGDEELLVSCAGILLANAVKHTPEKGEITVSIDRDILTFTDGGAGYTDKMLNQAEVLFSSESTVSLDAGIELALASQIMIAHGARLRLSKLEDKKVSISMDFREAE